ncbi:MAG: helix-turn-helix domain-containing protein [Thermomicrobiales bacterium]
MIRNARQHMVTQEYVAKFERAIDQLKNRPSASDPTDPRMREIQIAALQSQLDDLRAELSEYDQLRAGQLESVSLDSLPRLADALIAARITSGLTQRQLAERLGLKEQQIQRYEATDYQSASLARMTEIASALQIEVRGEIGLPGAATKAA